MFFTGIYFQYLRKNFMATFYGWGSNTSRLKSHYKEAFYFLSLSPQKFQAFIWATLEGWKAESTLEPPNVFEHRTPRLDTQHLNHYAIAWLIHIGQ